MIDHLQIGPLRYAIREVQDLHDIGNKGKKQWLYGQIRWRELVIQLEANQADDRKVATLWHEALHGIVDATGHEHDEHVIDALAFGLVQLIRDNPGLIAMTVAKPDEDNDTSVRVGIPQV